MVSMAFCGKHRDGLEQWWLWQAQALLLEAFEAVEAASRSEIELLDMREAEVPF